MRSISLKILLAFFTISLAGTGLFFIVARQYSNQEIRDYLFLQDQSSIAEWLAEQYKSNGSWDNLGTNKPPSQYIPEEEMRIGSVSPFILVDKDRIIIQGGSSRGRTSDFIKGESVTEENLVNALEIILNGEIIGWLIPSNNNRSQTNWQHPILDRMNELLLISAGGAILLALILAFVFSRSLSRPLKKLSAAAQVAATGDLSNKVDVKSKDEIGLLAKSFNQMMGDLENLISSQRQMTADIAHELRTPISVILGYTEGVHENVVQPTRETFEIVHDEALRLERMVKDLSLISKADVGELSLELLPVPVDSILMEIDRTSIALLQDKNIKLEINKISPQVYIVVDANRIIQVIRNLIENAVRYSPEKSTITIAVETQNAQLVRFSIQDQGPGVPQPELPKIFDRFYRVEPSRTRDQYGAGLGLAIARSIIEKHGGTIHAESPPGEGLKVIFTLPLA